MPLRALSEERISSLLSQKGESAEDPNLSCLWLHPFSHEGQCEYVPEHRNDEQRAHYLSTILLAKNCYREAFGKVSRDWDTVVGDEDVNR